MQSTRCDDNLGHVFRRQGTPSTAKPNKNEKKEELKAG